MKEFLQEEEMHNDNQKIEVEILESEPKIFKQTITFLKYQTFCPECLGRQFSILGTATDNTTRANSVLLSLSMECHATLRKNSPTKKFRLFNEEPLYILQLLANNAGFIPAKKVLEKWLKRHPKDLEHLEKKNVTEESDFSCSFCNNLFLKESLEIIYQKILQTTKDYHFNNFLIGTYLNPKQANHEEEFRSKFNVKNGESFKANLNRIIGKKLQDKWGKKTKYEKPDIIILIDLRNKDHLEIELKPKSLYIRSRYKKFVRNLPQTHWNCFACRGRGFDKFTKVTCPDCKGTGDYYESSVHDLIKSSVLKVFEGEDAVFHGAGREDVDARCLGTGRPFVTEIKKPKYRNVDLKKLTNDINELHAKKIYITPLSFANKQDIIKLKKNSQFSEKKYHALVYLAQPLLKNEFDTKISEAKSILDGNIIQQRTPLRVLHRRADITREKKIKKISGKYIDPKHIFLKILAQGGTYIKELISGDNLRTNPSFSKIFGIPMFCVELDVVKIN